MNKEKEQDLLLKETVGLGLCEKDEEAEGKIDDERDGNYVDQQSRSVCPSRVGCLSSSVSVVEESISIAGTLSCNQADNGSIALASLPKACEDCKTIFLHSSASSDRLCSECRAASLRVRLLVTNTGYVVGSKKDKVANATRQVDKEHKAPPNPTNAQAGNCHHSLDKDTSLACKTLAPTTKPSAAIHSSKRQEKRKLASTKKRTSFKEESKRCNKSSSGRRSPDGDCTATSPPKGVEMSKQGQPPAAPLVAQQQLATSITIPSTTSILSSTPSSSLESSPPTKSKDANPLTSSSSTSGKVEGKPSSKGQTIKRSKKRKHKPCRVCKRSNPPKDGTCSKCGIVPPAKKSKSSLSSSKASTTKKRKVIPGEQPAAAAASKRQKTSDNDAIVLQQAFRKNRWPSRNERIDLALQLEWTVRRVQIWCALSCFRLLLFLALVFLSHHFNIGSRIKDKSNAITKKKVKRRLQKKR